MVSAPALTTLRLPREIVEGLCAGWRTEEPLQFGIETEGDRQLGQPSQRDLPGALESAERRRGNCRSLRKRGARPPESEPALFQARGDLGLD
jgi:hypothetical protein